MMEMWKKARSRIAVFALAVILAGCGVAGTDQPGQLAVEKSATTSFTQSRID